MIRVFYAHNPSDFDSTYEERTETIIRVCIAGMYRSHVEVENPNKPHHHAGYAAQGMGYFLHHILPHCDQCAFDGFPNGLLGHDVAAEAQAFLDAGKQVWMVNLPPLCISRVMPAHGMPPVVCTPSVTRRWSEMYRALPNGGRP